MKKIYKIILMLVAVICMVAGTLLPTMTAHAELTKENTILEDLKNISDFDSALYTNNTANYFVELVQVLEKDSVLYVYAYKGTKLADSVNLVSINIAVAETKDITSYDFYNYKIELLASENGFYKYKVNGLVVPTSLYREYNIPSIFTDEQSENSDGTKTTEKSYEVAKRFIFKTENNKTSCVKIATEVIKITDKFVGFVRYKDGFSLFPTSCDSHFVAFSTDKDINKLLEADVYFTTQTYRKRKPNAGTESTTYGDKIEDKKYLNYSDVGSYEQSGILHKKYTWERISTTSDFIQNVEDTNIYSCGVFNVSVGTNLTQESKANIENKQWVLRFFETDYSTEKHTTSTGLQGGYTIEKGTMVGDVSLLRLKFETDGVVYDLGVVDDKTNENDKPTNDTTTTIEPADWLKNLWSVIKVLLIIIPILIVTAILAPILPAIFSILVKVINFIINLIIMPFKAIKRKKDKNK